MSAKNVDALVKMISDQGKKHHLLLKKLDQSLEKEVGQMTVKELIQMYEQVSLTHLSNIQNLPNKVNHVR